MNFALTSKNKFRKLVEGVLQKLKSRKIINNLIRSSNSESDISEITKNKTLSIRSIIQEESINNTNAYQDIQQNQLVEEIMEYYKKKIAGLSQQLEQANKINKELITQVSSTNEKNVSLLLDLNNQQNQLQEITIQHQLENIDENSMKIEIDGVEFQERINKLNMEREETINKMKDLLQQFQQFRLNHQLNYNKINNIEEGGIQKIINDIKNAIDLLQMVEQSINENKKDLEQNLIDQNEQVKEKSKVLLIKLEKNRICFIHIRKVFELIPIIFKKFVAINQELQSNIQVLEDHVKKLEGKNKIFEKKVEILLKELNEQTNQEKQLIADQEIIYNCCLLNRLDIQNKYVELYKGFIEYTRVNIQNMVRINFKFTKKWNQNQNNDDNSNLIESIRSFITSLQESKESSIKNEIDSMERQLKRGQDLFQQIQSKFNNNSVVQKYNYKNIECILKFWQTLLDYKKKIDSKFDKY